MDPINPVEPPEELPILYQDETFVAVHKPSGLLVHRSPLARDADTAALQIVRDQLQMHIYPIHRLDRPTSGILLFALSTESAAAIYEQLSERTAQKEYWALVRGWVMDPMEIDSELDKNQVYPQPGKERETKLQEALTQVEPIQRVELQQPVGKYETARYTLLKVFPKTGRTHQIRRHLTRENHPLIGDTRYGDGAHNQFFRESYSCKRLMLAARSLRFNHPTSGRELYIECPLAEDMDALLKQLWPDGVSAPSDA
ncbi:MAG: pseudouridine synthase [Verrucomicrobiota bacterium]